VVPLAVADEKFTRATTTSPTALVTVVRASDGLIVSKLSVTAGVPIGAT
jgi:hypothetical protein